MHQPGYVFEDGVLRYMDANGYKSLPLDEGVGLVIDRTHPIVIRHGSADLARNYFERFTHAMRGTLLASEIAFLQIDPRGLSTGMIDHLNRAIRDSALLLLAAKQEGNR